MNLTELKEVLSARYVSQEHEWVDLIVNALNLLNITIVSNRFEGLDYEERRKDLYKLITFDKPYEEGFLELYTVEEADENNLSIPTVMDDSKPVSWNQLTHKYKNGVKIREDNNDALRNRPRIVSFYSFKGGVGRTLAMVHVAYILATRGKKVAIVDMDLEAPGVMNVFDPKIFTPPSSGLVDYFFDRMNQVDELPAASNVTEIFTEIELSGISGRLFVIPAGTMDIDYIAKVDNLQVKSIVSSYHDLWEKFVQDLNQQIKPDIILVDSRTGLNNWGALSILKVSDSVIFFAYPNNENLNGLTIILKAMKEVGYSNFNLVFSRVHDDKSSRKKVLDIWNQIKRTIYLDMTDSREMLEEGSPSEPIMVYYNPDLAMADYYPVKIAEIIFSPIANLIDEEIDENDLVELLAGTDRWQIIASLPYENLGFAEAENSGFFQKTAYVDKFLDEEVSVVTGKKGTGKTKLYQMMLGHLNEVKKVSRVNLDRIIPVSGHGHFNPRPVVEFKDWVELVHSKQCSWEEIWIAYLGVVLSRTDGLPEIRGAKYKSLKDIYKNAEEYDLWQGEHTEAVSRIAGDRNLSRLLFDYLAEMDRELTKEGNKVWLHYDKLDEDLEHKEYGKEALEGLFKLVQVLEGRHLKNIRFKIFIRQDIWDDLDFTNKSHFKGKTIKLEWNRNEFIKLALKLSLESETFKNILAKYKKIPQNIDFMDAEDLKELLQVLWGIKRESNKHSKYVVNWIYERLTDADENTFPRSLFMLLKGAREHELTYEHSAHIQAPQDRLLRSASLNKGLELASEERCDALRQEFHHYKDAFRLLDKFSDRFKYEDFKRIYKDSGWNSSDLLGFFLKTGIVGEENGSYRFAHIYIHGFRIKRTSKV